MTTKQTISFIVIIVAISFSVGRYTATKKIVETTNKTEQDNKIEKSTDHVDTNKHKVVTIIQKVDAAGVKETKTIITEDTSSAKTSSDVLNEKDNKKEDTYKKDTSGSNNNITVSVLGGASLGFTASFVDPVYGASVSRPILGPITLGVWGLSNKIVGFSIGLQF